MWPTPSRRGTSYTPSLTPRARLRKVGAPAYPAADGTHCSRTPNRLWRFPSGTGDGQSAVVDPLLPAMRMVPVRRNTLAAPSYTRSST
jgi:hypothetical protein